MSKTKPWFTKVRGSYLPCSWQGWLAYIPFVVYLVAGLLVVVNRSDKLGYIFFGIIPQWVAAAVVMTWIASRKS